MKDGKVELLAINGISNNGKVDVIRATPIGIMEYSTGGSCNVSRFLPTHAIKVSSFIIDQRGQQAINTNFILSHDLVFCEIADANSHSRALDKAQNLYLKINKQIPWINKPHKVLNTRRDKVPELLAKIDGVIAPRTLNLNVNSVDNFQSSVESNNFSLPVLLRPSGSHGGKNLILIENFTDLDDVDLSLYDDAFVTEFVDYKSENIYTKYRFAVVAGEPILRHVIFHDHWIIHSGSRAFMEQHPEFQQKEARIIESFEEDLKLDVADAIHRIYEKIGLDYFGIDCAIKDGQIIIFEVNANMNILNDNQPKPNIWEKQVDKIIEKLLNKLIAAKVK